ncbi:MAG TPA: AAA family ATPase [Terriglobales bacterium]|nr:AAA family ATPase [Terriglobales bacterium]
MQAQKDITFGGFRLDFTNECLWQGARSIALRPKAFAVLKLLVENPGQLVSKQLVLDTVWPGTFVGDAVLKDNIRQLREALDDNAASPTYIETAHRRGYRFIGQRAASAPIAVEQHTVSELGSRPSALPPSNPILGREGDLAKLRSWLERSLAGERQTVFVTGEPGIGKTTTVNAFVEIASRTPGLLVARGQCLEHYGSAEAYLPVLDGFTRLCRSPGGHQMLDVLRQQAPTWLAQMSSLIPPSERAALQSQVAGATRERMMREMADAIEKLTSESPLLLVFEDLHWSDYSTLDLVSHLARRHDPARLMVIGTYRPVDVIVGDHALKGVKRELQAHGLCHELPLEYLSETAIGDYLTTRFPLNQFPARLKRTIHQRTEGNPLFMINLMEYLIDQRIVVEEQEIWKLRVDLSEVEQGVPSNLRQLIEKQLERLSPDERAVLEAASVAGMECSSIAIAAGLESLVESVEKHCEELARRHQFLSTAWLVELPDGSVTPRHRFVHILYHEVTYRLIPPMRRSQIHQRIAERGVAIYGDCKAEIAAELAMHFEQSRDWPRALQYLIQAAQNATHKSAHHEAIELARRGLRLLKSVPEAPERDQQEIGLRMILSVSLMAVKGFASPEVEEGYIQVKHMFRSGEPSPKLFNVLYLLGLFYIVGGKISSALEIARQLLPLADEIKDPMLVMEANRAMGSTLIELGRCTDSIEYFDRASKLYSANRHLPYTLTIGHDCKVLTEGSIARAMWTLGFPDAALERMRAALAFARELSHPQSLIGAAHLCAQLHQLRGETRRAQELASEVIEVAEQHGLELWVALGKIDLGSAEAELGNAQHGIELMQEGLCRYEATGGKLWSPVFLGLLADALAKAGRTQEGLATIEEGLTLAEQTGERFSLADLYRIKGDLTLKDLDLAKASTRANNPSTEAALSQARSCFTEALAIAKQQGTRSWELRAAMSMHRLELMMGNSAHKALDEIYSSFTEGLETADLKQARGLRDAVRVAQMS